MRGACMKAGGDATERPSGQLAILDGETAAVVE
jgi:hypothetical protein